MINLQSKSNEKSQLLVISFPTPPYWVIFSCSLSRCKRELYPFCPKCSPWGRGVLWFSSKTSCPMQQVLQHSSACQGTFLFPGYSRQKGACCPFCLWGRLMPHPSVSLLLCDCQVRDTWTDFLPIGYIRKTPMRPTLPGQDASGNHPRGPHSQPSVVIEIENWRPDDTAMSTE